MSLTTEIIAGIASGAGTVFLSGLSAFIAMLQKRSKRNKYNSARLMEIKRDVDNKIDEDKEAYKKMFTQFMQMVKDSKIKLIED